MLEWFSAFRAPRSEGRGDRMAGAEHGDLPEAILEQGADLFNRLVGFGPWLMDENEHPGRELPDLARGRAPLAQHVEDAEAGWKTRRHDGGKEVGPRDGFHGGEVEFGADEVW